MAKPPTQLSSQADYVKSAVRLPPLLHRELQDAAEKNGRSMNAEIIARLLAVPVETQLSRLAKDQRQLVAIAKEILAAVGGR